MHLQSAQNVSSYRYFLSSLRINSHGFRGSCPICSVLQCLSQPRMPSSGKLVLNRPGGAVMRVVALGAQKILGEAYATLVAAGGAHHHF